MLEARSGRYALVACLAWGIAACGTSSQGSDERVTEERSNDVTGCSAGSRDGTCTQSSTPQQCKLDFLQCLEPGISPDVCQVAFEECLGNLPPPEPVPPQQLCQEQYQGCVAAGAPEERCGEKLTVCLSTPPPPPPPSSPPPPQEDECSWIFRGCYDATGDRDACFVKLQVCLGNVPPPAPPPPLPPPTAEQCQDEYQRCLQATGDAGACGQRRELCLVKAPPSP